MLSSTSLAPALIAIGLVAKPATHDEPAVADADADVVPVGLSYVGDIPERERRQIDASFETKLGEVCKPPPCTENCGPRDATIGAEIGGDSRNYTLRWAATDPRLDAPLIVESSCELCSLSEVEEQFATDLGALCSRLETLDAAPGLLEVTSEPDGARVFIDGQPRGRTPWIGEVAAGEHTLELRARGHRAREGTVVVTSRVESREHMKLLAVPKGQHSVWPAWMSIGVGFALGIAGTTLIAIDGKEWQGRCSGADVDANGHCRFVYATRPVGIGLAIGGAAALATGAGLMVWTERAGGRLSGLGVGVRGRF